MKADAVFEGGGVKGVAFVGAIAEMERRGYTWEQLAGTSAGSIVAALLSAGYKSDELYDIFMKLNFTDLFDRTGMMKFPVMGIACRLLFKKGVYSADGLERLVAGLLLKKGIRTFGDLSPDKLRVIASDITTGKMLILPEDLTQFGLNPRDFSVAKAVRMSCSIPYFFQPYVLYKDDEPHYIVDGALLSNFPVWLFDVPGIPSWPTFGFRFSEDELNTKKDGPVKGLISYSKAIVGTMLDAQEQTYVKKAHAVRTIFIPTLGVKTTDFHITDAQKQALYKSGEEAVRRFFADWDFNRYVSTYRKAVLV